MGDGNTKSYNNFNFDGKMASKSYSVVEFYNENQGYKCGYCKSKNTNFSHGMWAHQLSVYDYQDLIDRGWRRSGHYCYKPTLWKMCCPSYTIRCDAVNFKISKSQKKIIKRMNRFLAHGDRGKQRTNHESDDGDEGDANEGSDGNPELVEARRAHSMHPGAAVDLSVQHSVTSNSVNSISPSALNFMKVERLIIEPKEHLYSAQDSKLQSSSTTSVASTSANVTRTPKAGAGQDKERPPCKKAKLIRLERRQQKLNKGVVVPTASRKLKPENTSKSLEEFFNAELPESPAHRLQVRLVRSQPPSADFTSSFKESLSLYRRYQMTVHGDPESKCTESQYRRFLVRSPLELKLVALKSRDFINTFNQSWCLYAKYQKAVHRETDEECDKSSYLDFLVASPIKAFRPADGSGPPQGYGSFHQQYWLDDQLIAVGVLDILPRCVSSVYFYYDPDYSDLTLGTYGSLREVAFTRTLNHNVPELLWYCMGFYIHSCPKMRYKAGLSPSLLLCPESLTWHPIEHCLPLLEKEKYCRLNPDRSVTDEDAVDNLNQVLVLFEQCAMDYGQYCQLKVHVNEVENEAVSQYASLVGKKCVRRMLLLRQTSSM